MQITPHWTEATLAAALALSDEGEVAAEARAHAAVCPVCAAALAEARAAEGIVAQALGALDHPVPTVDVTQIFARATARSAAPAGPGWNRSRRPFQPTMVRQPANAPRITRRMRWGSALVLGIATAAAAAAPRSPVRHFITRLFAPAVTSPTVASVPRTVAAPPALPASPRSVAIVPRGNVSILFHMTDGAGVLRILPTTSSRVTVRSSGDGAIYTVGQNVIMVEQGGLQALDYDVELPPVAQCPNVQIRVGDRVVYSRTNDHVHADVTPDATGRYVIRLARGER